MKRLLLAVAAFALSASAYAESTISPFDLSWVNGNGRDRYTTAAHSEAVFVEEFFSLSCGACNENAANVDRLAAEFTADANVQVLDMCIDGRVDSCQQWVSRHTPNHPVLFDQGRTVWRQVAENYIPTTLVTNCKGEVQYHHVGTWEDADYAAIKAKIEDVRATPCK